MKLALYRYQLPLTKALTFRGQTITQKEGLLVQIDKGWGDISPLPGFSKESCRDAEAEALAYLKALAKGESFSAKLPSVQFGMDCAHLDWTSLESHVPKELLPQPYPLIQGTPKELLKNWHDWLHNSGGHLAKIKVGRYPMRDELALVRLLLDRRPQLKLILDANQAWNREEAWAFCSHLDPNRIEYVEDPCASVDDIRFVAARTGISMAFDEVLWSGQAWEHFPQLKALVLKPTLIGSLEQCKAVVAKARAMNLQIVISSSFESSLGLEHLARLSAEWAPKNAPGLDTKRWFADDLLDIHGNPDLQKLQPVFKHG